MARQRKKKNKSQKQAFKGPADRERMNPLKTPLTEASRGRMMQGVVRHSERQPGRSS